jgi:hypothetical protein
MGSAPPWAQGKCRAATSGYHRLCSWLGSSYQEVRPHTQADRDATSAPVVPALLGSSGMALEQQAMGLHDLVDPLVIGEARPCSCAWRTRRACTRR